MPLSLYRRHQRGCEAGYTLESKSGEFEERKRGWKRCGCFIFAAGTLAGKFKRRYTGKIYWDEAKAVAAKWEEAGSWDGILPPPAPLAVAAPAAQRIPIDKAVSAFIGEKEGVSAPNTIRKNRGLLNKLKAYSESKGYVMVDQWTPIDVREFRTNWRVAANTAANNMVIVKSFFQYCFGNGWIPDSPAKLVKDVRTKHTENAKERIPFSDEEIRRMFEACEAQYGKKPIRWSREAHGRPAFGQTANYKYKWNGEDLADFISVSIYTGLRISDVCTFRSDRLVETGECHIRTTKTGRKVYTWLPEWLRDRIRARVEVHGPLIFGSHSTTNLNVVTDLWRRKLNKLWTLCGPWPEKPTPHRFRHTFARILLQKSNVTVRDVAELLGDTEDMVIKHYAAWIPERQARLTKILQEAFEDKPRPKSISTPGPG